MPRVECYIKGEESNAENKTRDVKERGSAGEDEINYYPPLTKDRGTFKRQERRKNLPSGQLHTTEHKT